MCGTFSCQIFSFVMFYFIQLVHFSLSFGTSYIKKIHFVNHQNHTQYVYTTSLQCFHVFLCVRVCVRVCAHRCVSPCEYSFTMCVCGTDYTDSEYRARVIPKRFQSPITDGVLYAPICSCFRHQNIFGEWNATIQQREPKKKPQQLTDNCFQQLSSQWLCEKKKLPELWNIIHVVVRHTNTTSDRSQDRTHEHSHTHAYYAHSITFNNSVP